jgi:hypothetical protein
MMLGKWAGAVTDAEQIPTDFVFLQIHNETAGVDNNFRWWGYERNETSVWGTPFAEWGLNLSDPASTGDPRVPYDIATKKDGSIEKGGDNRRPFYRQLKWDSYGDDIPVIQGTEMRLIEAEALLVDGQWGAAVAKINEVRDFHGLDPVAAASEAEAWTLLMRERGLELWLQGKRLPDLRRWAGTPGSVEFEVVREENAGQPADTDPRRPVLETLVMDQQGDLCLQVSKNERNSNRNIQ